MSRVMLLPKTACQATQTTMSPDMLLLKTACQTT